MRYVYVLKLANASLYTGTTNDLKKRPQEHNAGKVVATKSNLPAKLVFYEAFENEKDAWRREKYLKSGWGRRHLREMLRETLDL